MARLRRPEAREARYEVHGVVGRGGMGTVLLAVDRELGRRVAMKVLGRWGNGAVGGQVGVDQTLRFLEEAQVTGQLDHPGIVPVHDLGIDSVGRLWFTMKLVRGRTLAEVFDLARAGRDGWSQTRVVGVFLKVCEALAFAHSRGVVHRDLKPSNVMVGRFGETYVMDWGLARLLHRSEPAGATTVDASSALHTVRDAGGAPPDSPIITADGRVIGTPAFMAPEQAEGRIERITPAVDVYAVGAMLYQMLTGAPPYVTPGANVSPHTVLARVLAGPPAPVVELAPQASADLVAVCEKAMARAPERRYATAMDLAADLEAFLDRRPVRAQPGLLHALRLALVRQRAAAIATGLAAVALIAFGWWSLGRLADSRLGAQRLSDLMAAKVLVDEEHTSLTPRVPASAEATQRWCSRVDDLLERVEGYRLEQAHGSAVAPLTAAEHDSLLVLLDRLAVRREVVRAEQRMAADFARPIEPALQAKWAAVFEDLQADKRFAALARVVQPGLLPLRRNGAGFWQFLLLCTGAAPTRDGPDASYHIDDATGIVLVLLPGGDAVMGWDGSGAQPGDGRPQPDEAPRTVTLPPFLIASHETTQAQWLRQTGSNPSRRAAGVVIQNRGGPAEPALVERFGLTNPVESVTWYEAARFAARAWARLPTEAELEYVGRSASPLQPWFNGRRAEDLAGHENLRDRSFARQHPGSVHVTWDDEHEYHAPVGSFLPDSFGLFDVAGNVSEWTSDYYGSDVPGKVGAPDPPGTRDELRLRSVRGGSWGTTLDVLRASYRQFYRPDYSTHWLGVRVARSWASVT